MAAIVSGGVGDHGVLCDDRMALFPSREQAMAFVRWLIGLGLSPSYWMAVANNPANTAISGLTESDRSE